MINNQLTIFDCTLREVGYQTGWFYDKEFCQSYYEFVQCKWIDYLELGFFHNKEHDPGRGAFRYCSLDNQAIIDLFAPIKNFTKLSSMRDIQRPLAPVLPQKETCIDAIRILTRSHETNPDDLKGHIDEIQGLGYEVFVNFTSAGQNSIEQNVDFAKLVKEAGVSVVYFADTESVFTPDYVIHTVDACRAEGVEVGMHFHDKNGTANMLLEVALNKNCKYTDATLLGLGGKWHDGNLALEHIFQRFGIQSGYELTQMKTMLIQELIKYHEHSTAVMNSSE